MLRHRVDIENLDNSYLPSNPNPNVLTILQNNLDNTNWVRLSANQNAISLLLENNIDKIDWRELSRES